MFFPCIFSFFFFFPLCTFSFFLSLSIPLTAFSFQIINKKKIILCCIFLFLRLMPTIFHFHSSHSLPFNYGRELHSSQRTRELSSDTDCLRTSNNQIGSKENDPSLHVISAAVWSRVVNLPLWPPTAQVHLQIRLTFFAVKKKKRMKYNKKKVFYLHFSHLFNMRYFVNTSHSSS